MGKVNKKWRMTTMISHMNRINPNQTQVFFEDGRLETLTNEELNALLNERGMDQQMIHDSDGQLS